MRPTWDEYFMAMAYLAASRSTCLRRKVGAVIVRDRRLLATGYNGPPKGLAHCDVTGCIRSELGVPRGERHELCRGLHAEQNAIIQAAVHGISVRGATIYVTNHPCVVCAKMIINSEIEEIVYAEGYPDRLSEIMLIESGLTVRRYAMKNERVKGVFNG